MNKDAGLWALTPPIEGPESAGWPRSAPPSSFGMPPRSRISTTGLLDRSSSANMPRWAGCVTMTSLPSIYIESQLWSTSSLASSSKVPAARLKTTISDFLGTLSCTTTNYLPASTTTGTIFLTAPNYTPYIVNDYAPKAGSSTWSYTCTYPCLSP